MKRITLFLAFAFGIAWLLALVIYLTGGLAHSVEIVPGSGITVAVVLMAYLLLAKSLVGELTYN
jgi:hypothetical protein